MKYFKRSEFACKCGCGFNTVDYYLVQVLDELRQHFDKPIRINSGCRCAKHNENIGGSKNSQHLIGRAADIQVLHVDSSVVHHHLTMKYPQSLGLGLYDTFVHVDTRDVMARF